MNQWILSMLRLQLQMETVRGFRRNLERYNNITNKNINWFFYVIDIWVMSLRYTELLNNFYINARLQSAKPNN
jgi:hypothetical protein